MNADKELSILSGIARSQVEEISHLALVIATLGNHPNPDLSVIPGIGLIGDQIASLAMSALEEERTAEAAIEKEAERRRLAGLPPG
jgi:hypothetical protein